MALKKALRSPTLKGVDPCSEQSNNDCRKTLILLCRVSEWAQTHGRLHYTVDDLIQV